jgi:plasmid stabilization system protein ParE
MEPKLSSPAAEALYDIILHRLQNDGLQQAEAIEKAFYAAFKQIEDLPVAQTASDGDILNHIQTVVVNNEFAVAYQPLANDVLVLDIAHISRYANVLNHS